MRGILPLRHSDRWGKGEYRAPRGKRSHRGVDFACLPGTFIYSDINGEVSKLGYPYKDELSYRYIQVTDKDGNNVRYFYLEPTVQVGIIVTPETILGAAQDLTGRYPGITNHVHLEIKQNGSYLDPNAYLQTL